jgi:hypothetical protein
MIQFLEIGSTISTHTSCIAQTIFLELDALPLTTCKGYTTITTKARCTA